MRVIGITGGIGAGKSTILDYIMCNYNAYAIMTDIIRARVIMPGGEAYNDIINTFGNDILTDKFFIDRNKLYAKIFSNEIELIKFNKLVTPFVNSKLLEILGVLKEYGRYDIVLIESATLFEDGHDVYCDEIWYIHTDIIDRKQRIIIRGDLTEDIISNIIQYQKMPSEFKKLCNKTVDNSKDINDLFTEIDNILK